MMITAFDRPYPADKQAEGIAVSWAVVSGACNKCKHLNRCERDGKFLPPSGAACMIKKAEILQAQKGGINE